MPWRVRLDPATNMLPPVPESPFKLVATDSKPRKPDQDAMLLYVAISMRENYCLLHKLANPDVDSGYNQAKGIAIGIKSALGVKEEQKGDCLYFKKGNCTVLIVDQPPAFVATTPESKEAGAFRWSVQWMCPVRGGCGTHYSKAATVEDAIAECKREVMYDLYGTLRRPDLKITDVWEYVQYGEGTPLPKSITQVTDYGTLVATRCGDVNYPGIDIELINENDETYGPRVLVEQEPDKGLRVLVWDGSTEDYNKEIILKKEK